MVARGKMYKRDTFEHLAPHSELVRGKDTTGPMSARKNNVRNKMVVVRVSEEELDVLTKNWKKSNEKTRSNYLRKLALNKPVTVLFRNASADDFLEEIIRIKRELNAIGNNFNQAVHRLHTLDKIPEFRKWINTYGTDHHQFRIKTDQLLTFCHEITRLWSQESQPPDHCRKS